MTLFKNLFTRIVPTFVQSCTLLRFLSTLIKDTTRSISRIFLLYEFYSINNLIWMNRSAHSAVCYFLRWWFVWTRKLHKYWRNTSLVTWLLLNGLLHLTNFTTTKHSASGSELLYRLLVRYEVNLAFLASIGMISVLLVEMGYLLLRSEVLLIIFSRRLYLNDFIVFYNWRS